MIRKIKLDNEWVIATDAGCKDFDLAKFCREHQHGTDRWWQSMERARNLAQNKSSLPDSVPQGGEWIPKGRKRGRDYVYDDNSSES